MLAIKQRQDLFLSNLWFHNYADQSNDGEAGGEDGKPRKRNKGRPVEMNHDMLAAYIDAQVR